MQLKLLAGWLKLVAKEMVLAFCGFPSAISAFFTGIGKEMSLT